MLSYSTEKAQYIVVPEKVHCPERMEILYKEENIIGNKYCEGQHCVARVSFAITAEVRCNLDFLTGEIHMCELSLTSTTAALSSCCTQQGIRVNRRFHTYSFAWIHQMTSNE